MVEVHVTFPNTAEAHALSLEVVERRLAACANIAQPIHSYYWWHGSVQSEDEVVVVFKTIESAAEALMSFVAERHSYDVPAIIVLRPLRVARPYEDWVNKETLP